jgi:hypothetical protein
MKRICNLWVIIALVLFSCKSKTAQPAAEAATPEVETPVTVTSISTETLTEVVDLNAMSSFLQSSFIKSTANGYIKSSNVKLGQFVHAGQLAFLMQTKEAKALGNTINNLDPSFRFSGLIKINASQNGYITAVNHQAGDYVQDGEQLAVLSDSKSFGFLLNLPYELRQYLANNKTIDLELPDKSHLKGSVGLIMPTVDSQSQTQSVLIKVAAGKPIPQNLIAKVHLVKNARTGVPSLPKEAVLTDEAQSNFWVMKMIDSVTAVKVQVVKGMETGNRVEIIRPVFTKDDKIVLTGNYGLPDTAKVKIQKE